MTAVPRGKSMSEEQKLDQQENLGNYLVRMRREKNISFEELLGETKIPKKTLLAIESNDFSQLPPDAFARGFYVLYAKNLQLDHTTILSRYERERQGTIGRSHHRATKQPGQQVNTMAARPSMKTGSTIGFSLVILIAFVSFLSWYFSWNPATFLSEKLRSFQVSGSDVTTLGSSTGGVQKNSAESKIESQYFLTVDFLEDTTITISVDDGLPEKEAYAKGSTRIWYADSSITLIMPETAQVTIFFNGKQVDLPKEQDGLISLLLP